MCKLIYLGIFKPVEFDIVFESLFNFACKPLGLLTVDSENGPIRHYILRPFVD